MAPKEVLVMTAILLVYQEYGSCSSCSSRSFNINQGLKNRALEERILKTSTINNYDAECFMSCSASCACLSFNVCGGKQCQLNADAKEMKTNSLNIKHGCTYYHFPPTQATSTPPRCCYMSNPCLNGGICLPPSGLKTQRRFSCQCRSGFYGYLCETKNPRSCADFMTETVKPLSGEYKILDGNGISFPVYCDFDSEPGFAWTMILSFSRDNALSVQTKGLINDLPVNKDTLNWESYRLSLSQMTSIRDRSTHWRATCGFDVAGVDYQEYIRVNLSVVDLSTYYFSVYGGPTACQTIEYMNIWGTECHNCNFALYNFESYTPFIHLLHSDVYSKCPFADLSSKQHYCSDTVGANLFAVYNDQVNVDCFDPRSKCQQSGSSTTQNWFGKAPR